MKLEALLAAIAKPMATAGVSVAMFTLTPWTWAAALMGAAMSHYFEPEKTPDQVKRLLYGIAAMGFAAGMIAAAVPHAPFMAWTANVDIQIRAGVLGLSIRFLWEQGKRIASGWKRADGSR